jgi:hypothetical protein
MTTCTLQDTILPDRTSFANWKRRVKGKMKRPPRFPVHVAWVGEGAELQYKFTTAEDIDIFEP